jgi:hypothetical protein
MTGADRRTYLLDPAQITPAQARAALRRIRSALWPRYDIDADWNPDTLDAIAEEIIAADLGPIGEYSAGAVTAADRRAAARG